MGTPPEPPTPPEDERRRHTRTGLSAPAELAGGDDPPLPGRATDLSFGGAFFVPDAPAPPANPGDRRVLTLRPPNADGPIVFACEVARAAAAGFGLRFLATDPAGFERFTALVVLGHEARGAGRLVAELRVSPGFAVATGEGLRRALE